MAGAVNHPVFARFYAWLSRAAEPELGRHRERLLAGLSGRVVELGAGNGLNFAHYPAAVTEVVAVEPEAHLRRMALEAAAHAPVPVTVVDGVADALPLPDASVDAAVTSLVLCSVPDQAGALGELARVLRPGGQLRFLEHVRADSAGLARTQRALDATLWPHLAGGCHVHRDTAAAIRAAGFRIDVMAALRVPDVRVAVPTTPHIIGTATRH